jgi:hypothetical protein
MKLSDLKILKEHFDSRIDGYLVIARRNNVVAGSKSLKKYIVGWYSRHENEKLARFKSFMDFESARKYFEDVLNKRIAPSNDVFVQDWQDQHVYEWEDDVLAPQAVKIDEETARKIIKRVCADYKIPEVELEWKEEEGGSEYYYHSNKIKFGHRDNLALLHELAHAINDFKRNTEMADHGPDFVWITIELYHKYAGYNLAFLVATAYQAGLLGDVEAQRMMNRKGLDDKGPVLDGPRL